MAFTLAEVLITLVIIGVVAALTIPSVVISYQKHETVTRLKKAYTTIAQTTNKAIADHGPIKNWELENKKSKEFVDKYMLPYLNVAKNCGYEKTGECEFKAAYLNDRGNKNTFGSGSYKIVLSDGTSMYMQAVESKQTVDGVEVPTAALMIFIDINGKRPPNVIGLDVFQFNYYIKFDKTKAGPGHRDDSGKLQPQGAFNYSREEYKSSHCNKNETGTTCAALIMADNWQIKDDYPW